MQTENSWTIFPLLYLRANWSQKVYKHFDLDICLIKADQDTKRATAEVLESYAGGASFAPIRWEDDKTYLDVQWLLGIHLPRAIEHLAPSEIGISFIDRVANSIAGAFATCLRLVQATKVICPLRFGAKVDGDFVDTITACDDYFWSDCTEPTCECECPDAFKESDIQLLTELWTSIVQLRKLYQWMDEPFQETFFADLDKKAVEATKQKLCSLFSRPDVPEEVIENLVKGAVEARDSLWQQFYTEAFRKEFSKKEEQVFGSRTRIGRSLALFDEGLHLLPLHSFLSMCLVLETLFTLGRGEVAHKLAVRLAKVVTDNRNDPRREDYYHRVKKVYRERGHVVHASKLIEDVDDNIRRDSFTLARLSLQKILCSESLLKIYTGRESLEAFFLRKLDLDLK